MNHIINKQNIIAETSYERSMKLFNLFLQDNLNLAKSLAMTDPIIGKDDEWNNPEYDIEYE